ncbi:CSC1-like protein At1g32090 [Asparagus officinalis]|uniref:CSC1-like protein At1g32090 n=1 Tax=Asparagus officinalis TaxID=4686 RepID=UPI00098E7D68|nr:CSC1-like protein At1g32090 [Asparagus officinalis]
MWEALRMSKNDLIQHAGLDSVIFFRIYILGFWFHLSIEYLFTIWTCYVVYKEYGHIAFMRLHFIASQDRHAAQFNVVVRNIPHVSGHSISESVDQFFQRNHPEHYLGHQKGFLGLCDVRTDAIDYYSESIYKIDKYSLANLDGLEKVAPFLRPVIEICNCFQARKPAKGDGTADSNKTYALHG